MRSLTVALIGAGAVLVAVAVLTRQGAERPAAPAAAPGSAGQKKLSGQQTADEHSARVDERLARLRTEYERRQPAEGNPVPNKRAAPRAAGSARAPVGPAADEPAEELDAEDLEELEALQQTLRHDPDPDERIGAVLLLSGSEGPASMQILMDATDDPDPEVRLAAVEALGDRAEELSPSVLMKPLSDGDADVRFEAVSILGDMETPDALQLVKTALEDPDDDVRALAEGILDFADEQEGATGAKPPAN